MTPRYILTPEAVSREIEVAGKVNAETRDTAKFLQELGARAPFDTGWMPPGLRSYAHAGDYEQMVIEAPPGINRINWGESEGDPNCKTYLLAQPWRIIIADFVKGNLLGARMFYSPIPFNHPEQQLYHANVPNINCRGYNGNGVGWLCLYHTDKTAHLPLSEKMARVIERCSGVEAYNDRNMSGTDGPRFYAAKGKPSFTSNPKVWEEKSEKEGVEWTLDPELWIPVRVQSADDQAAHIDSGQPLTLTMAMNGHYNAYYGDSYHPKPAIALRRGQEPEGLFVKVVQEAYNQSNESPLAKAAIASKKTANPVWTEPEPEIEVQHCADCNMETDSSELFGAPWGDICEDCRMNAYTCAACEVLIPDHGDYITLTDGETYCPGCVTFCICPDCGYGIEEGSCVIDDEAGTCYCQECAEHLNLLNSFECNLCGDFVKEANKMEVTLTLKGGESQTKQICPGCASTHMVCGHCGQLAKSNELITTMSLEMLCGDCWVLCAGCGYPHREDEVDPDQQCQGCASKQAV